MIQKMKLREKMAIDYAKKYKGWDYCTVAIESYLTALEKNFPNMFLEEVEVEFKDGEHQLTPFHLGKNKV